MTERIAICSALLVALTGCGDDDGAANANNLNNAGGALCGDGNVEGAEECDEGSANSDTAPDACRTDCRLPHCGDGVLDSDEGCDEGAFNSDTVPNVCRESCAPPRCGDGVVDGELGEGCDDGNDAAGDGCSPACLPEFCGNGALDPGEECDDGNFAPGDGCGPICLTEACGNGFVDAAAGEACDDGNLASHDGCDSACRTEIPTWRPLPSIPPRSYHAMAYDSARDRIVAFGGLTPQTALDDTWEYDGTVWRQAAPAHTPGARSKHAMAYDSARGVVVLFAGVGPCQFHACYDTWEYDGLDWVEVSTATIPPGRHTHAMAYDSARGVVVLFGGQNTDIGFSPLLDDTWEYDGLDWVERTPTASPPGRREIALAYDAARGQVVLFGGKCNNGTVQPECDNATWLWDGTTWSSRTQASPPHTRSDHAMAWDSQGNRVVMYGGGYTTNDVVYALHDTWTWSGTSWARIAGADEPLDRFGPAMAFHASTGRTILLDGANPPTGDTWALAGSTWTTPRQTPPARSSHAMAFDESRGVTVLFGGWWSGTYYGDTWEIDDAAWTQRTPSLSPGGRHSHGLAYDRAGGVTVLFGGLLGATEVESGETWIWDGADWTALSPGQSPPARYAHAMAYDPDRGRLVLFGGTTSGDPEPLLYDDTWEFDGATWAPISSPHKPTARKGARLAFSSSLHALILHGGNDGADQLNDTWAFDGTDWSPIAVGGASPRVRGNPGMVGHEASGVVMLFGGNELFTGFDDTWELRHLGWVEISPVPAPTGRSVGGGLAYDTLRRRVLLFGGSLIATYYDDTWIYQYRSTLPPELCDNQHDDDGDGLADCADPDCEGLPCGAGTCAGGNCL